MKKLFLTITYLVLVLNAFTQKEEGENAANSLIMDIDSTSKTWTVGGHAGLFASQVVFVNWSAGGVSSISGSVIGEIFANYTKKKHSWNNDFKAEFGMIKNQHEAFSKNKDFFELNSKYGFQVDKKGKVFVGGLLKFSSQFALSKNLGKTSYSTNFMAPGRLVLAAGVNWKPIEMFSFFLSPAAGKFTFVTDKGVDETQFGLQQGKEIRTEFGAYLKMDFQKEVFKNLNVKSTLTLFNNFLDSSMDTIFENNVQVVKSNRGNIDVDWLLGIDFIFSRWLTVNIGTLLVYDHDVNILLNGKDGITPILDVNGNQKSGPRTQFTESLNIGLTYRFVPKEKKEVVK